MRRPTLAYRAVACLTLAALASSCVTTQLPPISSAGGGFEPLPDPRLSERIANTRQYLAAHPSPATPAPAAEREEAFARRIRPVVRDDARLNIEMGRLKLAEAELAQVAEWMPEDPEARFLRGRLKLAQAAAEKDEAVEDRLRGEAAEAFREAIQLDPDRPLPHRELGLLLYGEGELEEACAAFRRYGELAPDAEDAGRFRDYVLEIERDGRCP